MTIILSFYHLFDEIKDTSRLLKLESVLFVYSSSRRMLYYKEN
jgi:hypothetical protein